jgi:predicted amidophosphoribosyltransferase
MNWKDYFWPQTCLNCSSANTKQTRICQPCIRKMRQLYGQKNELQIKGHRTLTLFDWIPGASDTLSALHHEMKESQKKLWDIFANEFVKKWIPSGTDCDQLRNICLVSIQSTADRKHGEHWGQSLSRVLKVPHVTALRKPLDNRGPQKQKNTHGRSQIVLENYVDISSFSGKKIVLVDDIVTTGSTLHAAYLALGQPSGFQAWCLSYRRAASVAEGVTQW